MLRLHCAVVIAQFVKGALNPFKISQLTTASHQYSIMNSTKLQNISLVTYTDLGENISGSTSICIIYTTHYHETRVPFFDLEVVSKVHVIDYSSMEEVNLETCFKYKKLLYLNIYAVRLHYILTACTNKQFFASAS